MKVKNATQNAQEQDLQFIWQGFVMDNLYVEIKQFTMFMLQIRGGWK